MKEFDNLQIEIIGGAPNKRDFCYPIVDENVRESVSNLLKLERMMQEESLTREEWGTALVVHVRLWSSIPSHYQSELADLTAITT